MGISLQTGSIHKKWICFFSLWIVFLSGLPAYLVGSPGVLQSIRLEHLLIAKQHQLHLAELDAQKLRADAHLLENNRYAQLREIRRTLGYVAADEVVFNVGTLK